MDKASIGIKLADGKFFPVLEEGSPASKVLEVSTIRNDQLSVQINLFRAEDKNVDYVENNPKVTYIGSLIIEDIESKQAGEPTISLTLSINESNDLSAEAVDIESGTRQSLSVSLENLEAPNVFDVPDFDLLKREEESGVSFDDSLALVDSAIEESVETPMPDFDLEEPNFGEDENKDKTEIDDIKTSMDLPEEDIKESDEKTIEDKKITDEALEETKTEESEEDSNILDDFTTEVSDDFMDDFSVGFSSEPKEKERVDIDLSISEDDLDSGESSVESTSVMAQETDADEDQEISLYGSNLELTEDNKFIVPESDSLDEDDVELPVTEGVEMINDDLDINFEDDADSKDIDFDKVTDEVETDELGDFDIEMTSGEDLDVSLEEPTEEAPADDEIVEAESTEADGLNLEMPSFEEADEDVEITSDEVVIDEDSMAKTDDDIEMPIDDGQIETSFDELDINFEDEDIESSETELPEIDDIEMTSGEDLDISFEEEPMIEDSEVEETEDVFADPFKTDDLELNENVFGDEDLYDEDTEFVESSVEEHVETESTEPVEADDGELEIDSFPSFEETHSEQLSSIEEGNIPEGLLEMDRKEKSGVFIPAWLCGLVFFLGAVAFVLAIFLYSRVLTIVNKVSSETKETVVEAPVVPTVEPEILPEVIVDPPVEIETPIEITVVEEPIVPVKPEPVEEIADIRYKLKWGDTLWDLSTSYYKTPWLYSKIATHNKIKNPNLIIAGTYINIPPK